MFTDSLFDGDVDATVQTIKHHYDATGAFKTTTPSQRKRRPLCQTFSQDSGPKSKRSREDDRQGRTTNGYSHGTIGLYNASGSYNTSTGQPFRHQPSGATRGRWGQFSRKQGDVCVCVWEGGNGGGGGAKFNQKARLHHGPQGDESGKLSALSPCLAGADGQPLCHSDRRRRLPARVPLQTTHHGSLKGRSYGDKTRTSHFPPNGRRGAGSREQRRHRKEPSFTRVFQHCLSRPKEEGQAETGHQPKNPQPIHTLAPLPNDIVERRVPFGPVFNPSLRPAASGRRRRNVTTSVIRRYWQYRTLCWRFCTAWRANPCAYRSTTRQQLVTYLAKEGGTRSPRLSRLACRILQPWTFPLLYAFPPPTLVPTVVNKLRGSTSRMLLIAPCWSDAPWLPTLLELTHDAPRRLRPSQDLLINVSTGFPVSNLQSLRPTCTVWALCGRPQAAPSNQRLSQFWKAKVVCQPVFGRIFSLCRKTPGEYLQSLFRPEGLRLEDHQPTQVSYFGHLSAE